MNYHLARNGQQLGEFGEEDIRRGLDTGRFLPDDYVWAEGMQDWQPLGSVFSLAAPAPAATAPAPAPRTLAFPASPTNPYAPPQSQLASQSALQLASRGSRFGAAILDTLVVMALLVPVIVGASLSEQSPNGETATPPPAAIAAVLVSAIGLVGLVIYNLVRLSTHGQTLGKQWLNIRIVSFPDGRPVGFLQAVLLRSLANGIIGQLIPFYSLVDTCFIFGEQKRCVHDLIAQTAVVQGSR